MWLLCTASAFFHRMFTTDLSSTNLHLVPMGCVSHAALKDYLKDNEKYSVALLRHFMAVVPMSLQQCCCSHITHLTTDDYDGSTGRLWRFVPRAGQARRQGAPRRATSQCTKCRTRNTGVSGEPMSRRDCLLKLPNVQLLHRAPRVRCVPPTRQDHPHCEQQQSPTRGRNGRPAHGSQTLCHQLTVHLRVG